MKQPSDKDIDQLSEVATEVLWYLERGTDPREIARMLSKKHRTGQVQMLSFIIQLQQMAQRVVRGGLVN